MTDTTTNDQVMLTWKDLKKLGWPYSRTHTMRKSAAKIEVVDTFGKEPRLIDNPDPFPAAIKLGWHPNSPLVWPYDKVMDYLRRHGVVN